MMISILSLLLMNGRSFTVEDYIYKNGKFVRDVRIVDSELLLDSMHVKFWIDKNLMNDVEYINDIIVRKLEDCLDKAILKLAKEFEINEFDIVLTEIEQPWMDIRPAYTILENKLVVFHLPSIIDLSPEKIKDILLHELFHVVDAYTNSKNIGNVYEIYSIREFIANTFSRLQYIKKLKRGDALKLLEFDLSSIPACFSSFKDYEASFFFFTPFVENEHKTDDLKNVFKYKYNKNHYLSFVGMEYFIYNVIKNYDIDTLERFIFKLAKMDNPGKREFNTLIKTFGFQDSVNFLEYDYLIEKAKEMFKKTKKGKEYILFVDDNFYLNLIKPTYKNIMNVLNKCDKKEVWFGDPNNDGFYEWVVFSYDIDRDGGIDVEIHYPLLEKIKSKKVNVFGKKIDIRIINNFHNVKHSKYPWAVAVDINNTDVFSLSLSWPFFDIYYIDNIVVDTKNGYVFLNYPDGKVDEIKRK